MTDSEVEVVHEDINSWLFLAEYSIYIGSAVFNTFLAIIWIHYAYFSIGKQNRNTSKPTESKSNIDTDSAFNNDITTTNIEQQMNKATTHTIPFLGRLYILLSIITAMIFTYFYVLFLTLRKAGIFTDYITMCSISILGSPFYQLNRLFLYLYFIWRVDVSFSQTVLEMKKTNVKLLSIINIISFTFSIIFMVSYHIRFVCEDNSPTDLLIATIPFGLFDTTFAWLCLYLFVSRLRTLIKMDKNRFNDRQSLQYIANKFTILSVVAISSTTLIYLIYLVLPLASISAIDSTLNAFCLILSTKDYDLYYQKYCVLCRTICEKKSQSDSIKGTSPSANTTNDAKMVIH
eukprot:24313_1